jgi:cardiolipin synthase
MILSLSIIALIVLIGLFFFGNQIRLRKQYEKKQSVDSKLFQKVLNNMDQHLSVEEASRRFQIFEHLPLLCSIKERTHFPLTQNDRITILKNGTETFPALLKEIEQAKHHIHLLFYTVQDDQIGNQLLDLLIKKAEEGVEVRLLVDGVGSKALLKTAGERLKKSGIHFAVFSPPKLSFLLHLNFRNHRKIAVMDGRVGLIGGLNVGDEYLHKDSKLGYWRDIHVLIEGESVLLLQRIFATDWNYVTNNKIAENPQYFPQYTKEGTQKSQEHTGKSNTALVQVVPSGPDMKSDVVNLLYKEMILSAKKKIWLATPYFIPDQTIMDALIEARNKGIEVSIIVPKNTDNFLIQAASYHYFQPLLRSGVQIYQYKKGFYHAKIALVDDQLAKIGSANLDQRSFHYSFEAGLFIYHKETCEQVKQIFEQDFKDCTLLEDKQVKGRSFLQRTATQLSLLLAPWL